MRTCPCCGAQMKLAVGLRGTNPHYWNENGWRCVTGYDCDMVGYLLYEDYLADPQKIEKLAEYTRQNKFVQMVRAKRAERAVQS